MNRDFERSRFTTQNHTLSGTAYNEIEKPVIGGISPVVVQLSCATTCVLAESSDVDGVSFSNISEVPVRNMSSIFVKGTDAAIVNIIWGWS